MQKFSTNKKELHTKIGIWTLLERRWVNENKKPYEGEAAPGQALGNVWDLQFQKPQTALEKKLTQKYDLERTRRRAVCDKCRG